MADLGQAGAGFFRVLAGRLNAWRFCQASARQLELDRPGNRLALRYLERVCVAQPDRLAWLLGYS